MTTVSMGQLRFSGTSQCYDELGRRAFDEGAATGSKEIDSLNKKSTGYTRTYLDYQVDTSTEDDSIATGFADLVIKLNPNNPNVGDQYDSGVPRPTTFDRDTDYYAYIELPQDINYEMIFDIKLIKVDSATSVETYQYLKTFTVPRSTTSESSTAHVVALFALDPSKDGGDVKAMIPLEVEGQLTADNVKKQYGSITAETLYKRKNVNQYAVGVKSGSSVNLQLTDKVNATILVENWITEYSSARKAVEIVFRPVTSGFNMIKIQMRRTTQDQITTKEVTFADGTTESCQGRIVDLGEVQYKLFQLKDLVPTATSDDEISLDRIGVWSHPGLLMAVNGEEIRVGSSGFYELDVLEITSLGLVAQGYEDNWTLDYEFTK